MPSKEITGYFRATRNKKTRDDLALAVTLVGSSKIAIDCGCGAGSDIEFLRSEGFRVYAFDIEQEAIECCQERFSEDDEVILSLASFTDFQYPSASLVLADSSLFFCPDNVFTDVWGKITSSIEPDGVFVGSFLGSQDTMAGPEFDRSVYWPDVLVASEQQVRAWMEGFNIVSLNVHRSEGYATDGKPHRWHIISVVAQKLD